MYKRQVIILSIERDGSEFIPNADDIIVLGDKITVLESAQDALDIDKFLKYD